MDSARLRETIKRHEGTGPVTKVGGELRFMPYRDSVGLESIGYGRNLDHNGINEIEAEVMLDHDIARAVGDVRFIVGNFAALSDRRQEVVVNMLFNLGRTRFLKFKHFLLALAAEEYDKAADEMLLSKWAEQVGARATELSDWMRAG